MNTEIDLPHYPPLFFAGIADSVRRFLSRLSRKFTHPNVIMLGYLQNLWLLGSIRSAAELGIADILSEGPKSVTDLAEITGTTSESLYRVLRALASEGIFKESPGGLFSNTPFSKSMQEDELRYFICYFLNSMQFKLSSEIPVAVKSGKKLTEQFSVNNVFDHIARTEELNRLYNKAMTNTSRMQAASLVNSFDFGKFRHIVDVGGGWGYFLNAILMKYRNVKGTLFDLPNVINDKEKLCREKDFIGRLNTVAGSFFDFIPEGGDLYILKNILHSWSDEDSLKILSNIRKVIWKEGRILIIEIIIDNHARSSWGKMTDLIMMAATEGKERTEEQYRRLLLNSGFAVTKIKKTISPLSLIIAEPVKITD